MGTRSRLWRVTVVLSLISGTACGDSDDPQDDSGPTTTGEANATGDPSTGDDPATQGPQIPPPAGLRLLRSWEFDASIHALLGLESSDDIERRPDLVRANFSALSAGFDCYDDIDVEGYEALARDASARAFAAHPTPLSAFGCDAESASDPCVADFVDDFASRAFRRPLEAEERSALVSLAGRMTTIFQGDVQRGLQLTVATILQSPHFLYRVELGHASEDDPELRIYDGHEMASRLSFTLWGEPPDTTLRRAAASGELDNAAGVRAHAQRLLADPRAAAMLERFWSEHLGIERLTLDNYPRKLASEGMYRDMRNELRALVRGQLAQSGRARDFLDYDRAWLSPKLAEWYGLDADHDAAQTLALPPERRGFLTSGLFLVSTGHPDKTSPTRRGKFVLERILCRTVPPPPADVDLELPDVEPGEATQRDLLERHREDPVCSGCHAMIDPLGFALEDFDLMGRHRELDNGLPVNTRGELDGLAFTDAPQLTAQLREHPDTLRCIAVQSYRFVVGHLDGPSQAGYLQSFTRGLESSDEDLRRLVADIVSSSAFRHARGFVGDTEIR